MLIILFLLESYIRPIVYMFIMIYCAVHDSDNQAVIETNIIKIKNTEQIKNTFIYCLYDLSKYSTYILF